MTNASPCQTVTMPASTEPTMSADPDRQSVWVKICGLRDRASVGLIAEAQPDAIGLNFYPKSPRSVPLEMAAEMVEELQPLNIEPVGLFVNESVPTVAKTCQQLGLRTVQIHGDESPRWLAELHERAPDLQIVRAIRIDSENWETVEAELEEIRRLEVSLAACLVDARVAGRYGGSGERVSWELVARRWQGTWPRLILAGGLHPDNVAEAIRKVRPWGVDVASGVESSPGQKDRTLVTEFVCRARRAAVETFGKSAREPK